LSINLTHKLSQIIPFKFKLKLRQFGWQATSYQKLRHTVYYINTNFRKLSNPSQYLLPEDIILRKQLILERETYESYRNQEFIIELQEPVTVEPLMGGVIARNVSVVEECYALPTKQAILLPYFPIAVYKNIQSGLSHSSLNISKAISLRHSWGENNYFHFYNDILPKLALLNEVNNFEDYPIIVIPQVILHLESTKFYIDCCLQ
jgi:hypothetical protein